MNTRQGFPNSANPPAQAKGSMVKYVQVFAFAYLFLSLFCAAAIHLLNLTSGLEFGLAAAVSASLFAAWCFTENQARLPQNSEIVRYALLALLASWLVSSCILVGALVSMLPPEYLSLDTLRAFLAELQRHPYRFILGVLLLSASYYLAIHLSFWSATRLMLRGRKAG